MKVLLTGATGFVGSNLLQRLLSDALHNPIIALRGHANPAKNVQAIFVGDLLPNADWSEALLNVGVVIHLAARVHIMQDKVEDPLAEFRQTNTAATLNLAQQAADKGVRRFIYLSSIKVNGEATSPHSPFVPDTHYIPKDPYGLSKYEAEQGLKAIAVKTGMEVVIIRPPLVYGINVKANFKNMMGWLSKGIPLPLGLIHNKRSLVALDNLIDLITICIDHPKAANQTFLVSDDEDLSTTELLQRMAKTLGKPSRLIPVPSRLLTAGATLLGKQDMARRLCGSLQVDISHTKNTLGWKPPMSVDEALQKTADAYIKGLKL